MTIEIDNAKEEIKEIVERCFRCGLCKSLCPVFKIIKEEQISPRGKAILLDNENFEKVVYECTLCKACEERCPLDLKLCEAFINAKKVLIAQRKEIPENKELIKNLNKSGNVYGIRKEEED